MGWISCVLGDRDLDPSRSGSSFGIRGWTEMAGRGVVVGGVVGVVIVSRGEECVRWWTWCRFLPLGGYGFS